jgi:hypothetical protein
MKNTTIPKKLEKVLLLVNSLAKEDLGPFWRGRVFQIPSIKKPPIEEQVLELIEHAYKSQVNIARQRCFEKINSENDLTETEIKEFCEGGVFTAEDFPPMSPHPFIVFFKSLPPSRGDINDKTHKALKYRILFTATFRELGGGYLFSDDVENEINRLIDEWLVTLPDLITQHLLSFEPFYGSKQKYLEISRRYQELFRTCGQLASLFEFVQRRFSKENNYRLQNHLDWVEPYAEPALSETEVRIEADGTAYLQKSLFSDAIDGIDVRRIRLCEVCENLFWAKRLDQVFCSKACSGLQRVQRWREKSAEYELNRFQNEEKRARRALNNGSF